MNDALYIAATGMQAQQSQLNVIANNVANVNTNTFKRGRVSFSDMVNKEATDAVAPALAAAGRAAGVSMGLVSKEFAAGELRRAADPMSLAVQGEGFIEVSLPDGTAAYARGGALQVNSDRMLSTAEGLVLKQRIHISEDVRQVSIAQDGQVSARDEKGRDWNLGRIDLVLFARPAGLTPVGDNLYKAGANAGEPLLATAGEAGAGRLMQGYEEASNVKLIDEMVQMMVAQRAYEMSVKVVQAADEIAGMTNNLRK